MLTILCPRDNTSIHIDDVRNCSGTRITLHTLIIRSTMHFQFIESQRTFRRSLIGSLSLSLSVEDQSREDRAWRIVQFSQKGGENILRLKSMFAQS